MRFRTRVVDHHNVVSSVILEASDEASAITQLQSQGFSLLHIETERDTLFGHRGIHTKTSSITFVDAFNTELLTLMSAGLSLIESLSLMIEREADVSRLDIYRALIKDINQGQRFSAALANQSQFFQPLYIGLVRAAEQTSQLGQAFHQYADFAQRRQAMKQKLLSAMIYPAILLSVGGCVIFFLMFYVVPRFSDVYKDTGRPLPWLSQLLLSWGHFFQQHATYTLIGVASCLTLIALYFAKAGAHSFVNGFKGIPVIRQKIEIMEHSRIYLTLSMLLQGGIPLVEAITMLTSAVSIETQAKLSQVRHLVEEGSSLSNAFESHGLTDLVSLRLVRVGEKSGQLASMLREAGKLQEREVTLWIDKFSKAFEPLLMTCIGIIVGAIVILLYMPIFDLAGSIQ